MCVWTSHVWVVRAEFVKSRKCRHGRDSRSASSARGRRYSIDAVHASFRRNHEAKRAVRVPLLGIDGSALTVMNRQGRELQLRDKIGFMRTQAALRALGLFSSNGGRRVWPGGHIVTSDRETVPPLRR